MLFLETKYIQKFYFETLYNFKRTATSLSGYKHTTKAILKMKKDLVIKRITQCTVKNHSVQTKNLISQRTKRTLNPMYGKNNTENTKQILSLLKSKNIVELYDINMNLLSMFNYNVELAKYFYIIKSTVGRYIKSQKLFN